MLRQLLILLSLSTFAWAQDCSSTLLDNGDTTVLCSQDARIPFRRTRTLEVRCPQGTEMISHKCESQGGKIKDLGPRQRIQNTRPVGVVCRFEGDNIFPQSTKRVGQIQCRPVQDLTVFATSQRVQGNIGIEGADNLCQELADASPILNGTTYVAWLSTRQVDAASRIPTQAVRFVNPLGTVVAASSKDLLDGSIRVANRINERGETIPLPFTVWTGTTPRGRVAVHNCNDWTTNITRPEGLGAAGGGGRRNSRWTLFVRQGCSAESSLVCFQFA